MIKLKPLLLEILQKTWKGAESGSKGKIQMCHLNSRKYYFKNVKGNIQYCEGQVNVPLELGEYKWIDHAWNLQGDKIVDMTYGINKYEYRGNVVKPEYMTQIPKWMKVSKSEYRDINIRVSQEFGQKVFEK